jgi:Protein of unknown function DUF58
LGATTRGKIAIETCIALAFSAVLLRDLLIFTFFAALLVLVIFEAGWITIVTSRTSRFVSAWSLPNRSEKVKILASVYPGDEAGADFFVVKSPMIALSLVEDIEFASFSPEFVSRRRRIEKIRVDFKTPYAGEYFADKLGVIISSPLGLFEKKSSIPASFTFTVNPRVIEAAIASFKIFAGGGGIGETPTSVPGIGTEFYEIREYDTGDEFKKINWKATARFGELMVSDKAKEVGGSFYLVLESVATNYFDRDRLATAFLQLANSISFSRARFGIVVHDGENVTELKRLDLAPNSLVFAREVALDFADVKKAVLGEQFMPLPSHLIKTNRDLLLQMGFEPLARIEDSARESQRRATKTQGFVQALSTLLKNSAEEHPAVLYVSGMFGAITPLIEMGVEFKKVYGIEFIVLNPTAPWVVAASEEQGAEIYQRHLHNLDVLRAASIRYYTGDPLKVVLDLFSG